MLGIAREDGSDPVRSDQMPFLMSLIDQAALALERIGSPRRCAASPSSRSATGCAPPCCLRSAMTCARR